MGRGRLDGLWGFGVLFRVDCRWGGRGATWYISQEHGAGAMCMVPFSPSFSGVLISFHPLWKERNFHCDSFPTSELFFFFFFSLVAGFPPR